MGENDITKKDFKSLENVSRRKAVKTIAGGMTALAAYHVLPSTWSKPIIEQVFLPAHAATSGVALSDPCEIALIEGTQSSQSVKIGVKGFVSPPTGGVPVLIEAYGTPDSSKESVKTATNKDGQFDAIITLTTTTGIGAVYVTTTAEGGAGSANCSIDIAQQKPEQVPARTYFDDTLTFTPGFPVGWMAARVNSNGTATLVRINSADSRRWAANFSSVPGSASLTETDRAAGCGDAQQPSQTLNVSNVSDTEFVFTMTFDLPPNRVYQFTIPAAPIPAEPALNGNCGGS